MALNTASHILFYLCLALVVKFVAVIIAFAAYWLIFLSILFQLAPQKKMFFPETIFEKKPNSSFTTTPSLMMYPSSVATLFYKPGMRWAISRFVALSYWICALIFLIIALNSIFILIDLGR